jgi:PPOX class probable F420-dependent enzyme
MISEGFAELIGSRRQGVLVTLRKDGWPQLSNVNYGWDAQSQTIRISTTDDRAKTHNLRRDPRASFHVASDDFCPTRWWTATRNCRPWPLTRTTRPSRS